MAQGQVRLADLQTQIAAQQATQKSVQTAVAQLAAPDRVVAQGIALGLTAPAQVVDLPQVPLDVPLPAPDTAPRPRPPPPPAAATASTALSSSGARTRAMRLLLVVVFVLMVLRLVQVQEFGHQHYAALSKAQLTQTVTVPPVRGGIYDRNGEVLAETVTRQTVVADPQIIKDPARSPPPWRPCSASPACTLRSALTEPSGFVYLAHRVPDAVAAAGHQDEPERHQPGARVAAGGAGRPAGRAGGGHRRLERRRAPRGSSTSTSPSWPERPGTTDVLESPDGVALPSGDRSTPAQPGTGLELTLDESVQYVTEQALASEILAVHATSGTAVIMDVKTGDILAMANLTPTKAGPPGRPRRRRPGAGHPDGPRGRHADTSGADAGGPVRHPAGRRRGGAVRLGGHPGLRAGLGVQAGHLLGGAGRRRDHPEHAARPCRRPCRWASTRSTTPRRTATSP